MKDCNQCGKCCTKYSDGGLSASQCEIKSWDTFRQDISRYVKDGNIWMDPESGKQLTMCPWLSKLPGQNKFSCDIYLDRPGDCRFYPISIQQMINDECEMLEAHDLERPKQAQKKLDSIMADSRPSFE